MPELRDVQLHGLPQRGFEGNPNFPCLSRHGGVKLECLQFLSGRDREPDLGWHAFSLRPAAPAIPPK